MIKIRDFYTKSTLVGFTQPVAELQQKGIDDAQELISYCARVSNPDNQFNTETSENLIKYLLKHKHWSPLDMVDVICEIEIPRDIGRQILRHWTFKFQEFSQRYANPTEELGFVVRQARFQDEKNRQNSYEIDINDEKQVLIANQWIEKQKQIIEHAYETYQWAITNKIAKEEARTVLPEGLTMSRMYMKGSIRNWIHYLEVRLGNGTQSEHSEIARAIANVITQIVPNIKDFIKE